MKIISAGLFKAKCLALLDEVNSAHETIVVTKRGIPVAQVNPMGPKMKNNRTHLRGSILKESDLVSPVQNTWDYDQLGTRDRLLEPKNLFRYLSDQ